MKKILCCMMAGLVLLSSFSGCGAKTAAEAGDETEGTMQNTSANVIPDGNPEDVTCKGSYLGTLEPNRVVARCGSGTLTQGMLQAFYDLEVLRWFQADHAAGPDPSLPFSQQPCSIDETVNSWQQYFLRCALNTWHTAQALVSTSKIQGLPKEEAFQPNEDNYEEYMAGNPATRYLYRYDPYAPNSMHQAYLNSLPQSLLELANKNGFSSSEELAAQALHTSEDALLEAAKVYNIGYMYLTDMEAYLLPSDTDTPSGSKISDFSKKYADIRYILLKPGITAVEAGWNVAQTKAEDTLKKWANTYMSSEGTFAQLAHDTSDDKASYLQGGLYWHVKEGTLLPKLDSWVFDSQRQPGDTTVIRTEEGIHTLYYAGGGTEGEAAAHDALVQEKLRGFAAECRNAMPMTVQYQDIVLTGEPSADLKLGYSDLLYPDVAHERFPEIPLYLQQDYGNTRYGNYPLRTYGCGITSLAMLSSYMTDTELTPPIMCARYGTYCSNWGTDYTIFRREPGNMGYYLREQVFDPDLAYEALRQGYIVISCQQKGYWTKTGHYIVLEKLDEKGVQVRDSNIYNYKRIPAHQQDRHAWDSIKAASVSYWIFEKKPVRSELCARCGNPEKYSSTILTSSYLCKRCAQALVRRSCYLEQ